MSQGYYDAVPLMEIQIPHDVKPVKVEAKAEGLEVTCTPSFQLYCWWCASNLII